MLVSHSCIRFIVGAILLVGIGAILSLPAVAEPSLETTRTAKVEAELRLLAAQVGGLQERLLALESRPAVAGQSAPVSAAQPGPLSADALELLRFAARDLYGQIIVTEGNVPADTKARKLPSALPHLRAAERDFCWDGTPRSFAHWRAALQELVRADYVEPAKADGQRLLYRLTEAGYAAADHLTSGDKPSP